MFKNEKQTGCKTTKGKDGVNIDSYFIRLKEGKKNVHFVNLFHKFNKEIERERKYRKIEYDRNGDEFVKFNADYITMNLLSLLEDEPNFGEIDNPVVKIIFASSVYKTIKCELLEYIKENYSYKIVCEIDESGTIVKDNPFVISYGLE